MGTYITLELKCPADAIKVNKLWDRENPGFSNTFHLNTMEDCKADLNRYKFDPSLKQCGFKTLKDLNWSSWTGLGKSQIKITLGDYLCAEMAVRYLKFFDRYGNLFVENPIDDSYIREILLETIAAHEKASDCLVRCPVCFPGRLLLKNVKVRLTIFNGNHGYKAVYDIPAEIFYTRFYSRVINDIMTKSIRNTVISIITKKEALISSLGISFAQCDNWDNVKEIDKIVKFGLDTLTNGVLGITPREVF